MSKTVLEAQIDSNIGDVADGIDKAAKSTDNLDKSTTAASGGVKKLSVSFGSLMKATGIIGLLNKAFEVFQDVMKSNQGIMDGFNTALGAVTIAFNDLFKLIESSIGPIQDAFKAIFEDPKKAIQDFSTAIEEGFIKRFEQVGDVVDRMGGAISKVFGGDFKGAFEDVKGAGKELVDVYTGVDGSFETVKDSIVDYTKKVIDLSKAQVQANKDAEFAAVENAKLNAQYKKEAEDLRQIRDNVNLTFAERMEANDKLNGVLEKQQNLQRSALQTELDALQLAVDINANDENKLALKQKEVEMLQLEEEINGQMSEQKTNAVALENELRAAQQQTIIEGLAGTERELEELRIAYEEKVRLAELAGMDTAAITAQYEKEKTDIIEANTKKQVKFSEMSSKQQLGIASSTAGNMAKVLGEETAAGKAMAITQATIDTFASAQGAYKSMAGIPVVGPALGAVAAAAAIVGGMKNIQAIKSANPSGGGGGGGGGGGAPSAPATPAPAMMSGEFQLGGGEAPDPVRAFVVTDEMTNSQNQLANIRRRSTI
jgi:hypothetical protein